MRAYWSAGRLREAILRAKTIVMRPGVPDFDNVPIIQGDTIEGRLLVYTTSDVRDRTGVRSVLYCCATRRL